MQALIAQLSDLHVVVEGKRLGGVVDTGACLARSIERLNTLAPRPDLAILTGDLVDTGNPEEYRRLKALLAPLAMPYYLMPGNHDNRAALRGAFPDHPYLHENPDFIQYEIPGLLPVRMLVLDTVEEGEEAGRLDEPRLAWLEAKLGEDRKRPTLIFMHHPPFATGMGDMDRIKCFDGGKMEEIVRAHPQVERVICGHVHRTVQTRWAGTAACTAPSCAHQLALDLDEEGAHARFTLEPAGFLLHLWRPRVGVVTHACVVGPYEGPYPF